MSTVRAFNIGGFNTYALKKFVQRHTFLKQSEAVTHMEESWVTCHHDTMARIFPVVSWPWLRLKSAQPS